MKPKIIVYLPVIHKGYLDLFKKHKNADIFIANQNLIGFIDQEFDYLRKEIRSITPQETEICLKALLPGRKISLIGSNDLAMMDDKNQEFILPREDIFLWIAKNYLSNSKIQFDDSFLRWNRTNSIKENNINSDSRKVYTLFSKIITKTNDGAQLSSDWWRQVSAVAFDESDVKIIALSHNQHLPSPYTPYIDSDPRNSFHKGENIDLSTAIHAEAAIIANCANKGIPLKSMSMYVSTFPCPVCAKLIAVSGISTLYYKDGYSMLDGETVLKNSNVKLVKV